MSDKPKTLKVNGKDYPITGWHEDGLPIIKAEAIPTHHKDKSGNQIYDKDGNPKISVEIKVPPIIIGANPGKNG